MAADQIAISIPKTRVKERSSFTATVYFRQRSDASAATPGTVHYRIDNISTNETVVDWTSVSPSASVSISVPASANSIGGVTYGGRARRQRMQLSVSIEKDSATEVIETREYWVTDIYGVSS